MVTGLNWYYCCEFVHLTVLKERKKCYFALFLMMLFCFVCKWCFMHVVNAVVCTVVVYNSSFLLWTVAFGALTLWDWALWRTFSLYKKQCWYVLVVVLWPELCMYYSCRTLTVSPAPSFLAASNYRMIWHSITNLPKLSWNAGS